MRFLRHIIVLLIALMASASAALPLVPPAFNQAEGTPHHGAAITAHADLHVASRAPPIAVADIAVTGAVVAESGNGIIMHGHETHVASLGVGVGLDATNRTGAGLCFVAGTPVLTTNGYKNIEDIQLGDMVISRDEERQMTVVKPVTELFFNPNKEIWSVTLVAEGGQEETLGATEEHPFYVEGKGWVEAAELQAGDQVVSHDSGDGQGGFLLVKSVVLEDERQDTYNFEVADTHTYFVGKLNALVHNECHVPTGSFEQARNRALDSIGTIDPATRRPHIARNLGGNNPLAGKVVGFEARRPDGTWVRMRVDWDPDKGPHINTEIGKGPNAQKIAYKFPGSAEDALRFVNGNFNQ